MNRMLGRSSGAVALALVACVADGGRNPVHLVVSTRQSTGLATAEGTSTVVAVGSDTVILRSAAVVLSRSELMRLGTTNCSGGMEGHSEPAPSAEQQRQEREDCQAFQIGPMLLSLPLGAAMVAPVAAVQATAGSYEGLDIRVHAPGNAPADAALLDAHPDLKGVSVRAAGTFSRAGTRTDFTLMSTLEARQELAIDPPLIADVDGATLTLVFDVSRWFLDARGAGLVDPASANPGKPNQQLVSGNIWQSISVFGDSHVR